MSTNNDVELQKPSPAFIGASWVALLIGVSSYLIGLWNANMELNEKGYYLSIIVFGLFSAVSVQKSVRDRAENIPITNIYYGLSWFAVIFALVLLVVGLWNAGTLTLSEKGFYAVSMAMSLFASVAVQKNVRDMAVFKRIEDEKKPKTLRQHVPPSAPLGKPSNDNFVPPTH